MIFAVAVVAQHHALSDLVYHFRPGARLSASKSDALLRRIKMMERHVSGAAVISAYAAAATERLDKSQLRAAPPC